jgi:hypothetical protein
MLETERAPRTERLLVASFREVRGLFARNEAVSVGHYLRPLGAQSAALGCAILALPFLWPLSLGPLTIPASVLIVMMAVQIARPGNRGALPERFLAAPISEKAHRLMTRLLLAMIRLKRRFVRPRGASLVAGRTGRWICSGLLVFGALLLAVPIPVLPFTNTLPAAAIIFAAVGWCERDGFMTILSGVSQLLALALFATIAVVGGTTISAALEKLWTMVAG